MTNHARSEEECGRWAHTPLVWSREAPIASLVAVPGTPCRCTVSRRAIERMLGVARLGPSACLDAVDRCRPQIEAIAACKYAREGSGPDRCIHVTSADVTSEDAVLAMAVPGPRSAPVLAGAVAPVATSPAGIAA